MEDILLDRLFRGQTGSSMDVGAHHPFLDNNTYFFYERGWRGVNIEPLPHLHRLLVEHRPRDLNLAVAVSDIDFDAAGRLTAMTDPRGYTVSYSYDAANQLTQITDRNGRQRSFSFDNAGRLTAETWQSTPTRTISYSYDAANQLTSASDPSSWYNYAYDNMGRVTSVFFNSAGTAGMPQITLNYSYDGFGNRTGLTDSQNGSINYNFDADNRLTGAFMSVGATQGPQVTFSYDAASRLTSISRSVPNQATVNTAFSFDNANRLTQIYHSYTPNGLTTVNPLATYSYGYDNANEVSTYTGPEGTLNYSYDLAGQLTGVSGGRTETYGFDLNGNRTMTGYQTGTGNRLLNDGTYTYTYDNEGNMLTKTGNGQTVTYSWDYRNRLTEVVITQGTVTVQDDKFTYDLNDRRIGKLVQGGTQQWTVYDGDNPYADFSGTTLAYRYLSAIGQTGPLARFDGTNTTW